MALPLSDAAVGSNMGSQEVLDLGLFNYKAVVNEGLGAAHTKRVLARPGSLFLLKSVGKMSLKVSLIILWCLPFRAFKGFFRFIFPFLLIPQSQLAEIPLALLCNFLHHLAQNLSYYYENKFELEPKANGQPGFCSVWVRTVVGPWPSWPSLSLTHVS